MRRIRAIPKLEGGEPGSPLESGRRLAALGAESGPQAVAWEFLRRAGQTITGQGLQDQAEAAARAATLAGEAAGAEAFAAGAAPALRDDGTIAGAAFDQALMGAYLTRMDLSADELALKLSGEHPDDPEGFRTRWDQAGQALMRQLPPEFREPARMEWARKGMQQLAPIQRAGQARALAEANADLVKGMDSYRTRAANAWRAGDMAQADEFDAKYRQALAARTDLDPRKREAALLDYQDDMRRHAVLGDYDKAKARGLGAAEGFIKAFSDPKAHPDFDPDQRDKLAAEMTRDLHALKVEHQLAVTSLHAEASTAIQLARSGYAVPQMDGLIERAGRLDPKLAASLSEGEEDLRYQADVAKLPPAAILAAAQDWKAKADAAGDLTEKARFARRHQAAVEALGETAKALRTEPLVHASRQGLVPLAQFDPANPPAEALKDRIEHRDAVRGYYGLDQVDLLTGAEATNLVRAVTTAPPEAMADTLEKLAQGYGAHWPEIYGQMVRHKLPAEYRVLAAVDEPVARLKLAEAFQVGKDTLKKSIEPDAAKNIDKDMDSRLGALRDSLVHAPDGPRIVAEYGEAAKLLAYQYARTLPWDQAASQAVADLVDAKYDFVADDHHQARAPAGQGEAVRRQAERIRAALKPGDLVPLGDDGSGVSEDYRRQAAWVAAKRGKWVTNESDDGWMLLDQQGQPVMRADGSRVEMKFAAAGVAP